MGFGWGYSPYVSVAERRANAQRKMDKLRKQGIHIQGVETQGRKIARTFWGEAWCQHLESFSDFANRLPRGRTYVRNGSVCHLEIAAGKVKAIVSGSELYDVKIGIKQLSREKWDAVKERCSGKIGSLLELLQGRLSASVMTVVTDQHEGFFPSPSEIKLDCSCPDYAEMCKHVAAVLYGVGARLDEKPDLLFLLRGVNHDELIAANAAGAVTAMGRKRGGRHIAEADLGDLFGIEMLTEESSDKAEPISTPDLGRSEKSKRRQSGRRQQNNVNETQPPAKRMATSPQAKSNGEMHSAKRLTDATVKSASSTADDLPGSMVSAPTHKLTSSVRSSAAAQARLSPTGRTVRELRAHLELSQSDLARIIGVSVASVSTWEKNRGRLNLQERTLKALTAAGKLTKKQALKQLAKA